METYFFCSIFCLVFYVSGAMSGGRVCVSLAVSLALSISMSSWLFVGGATAFAVVPVVLSIRVVSSFSIVPVFTPGRFIAVPMMSVVVP
jgi:hypothetical protein